MKVEHCHDDETHIRALLKESGLFPAGGHGTGYRHHPWADPHRFLSAEDRPALPSGAPAADPQRHEGVVCLNP